MRDTPIHDKVYLKSGGIKDCEPVPGDFDMKNTGMDLLSGYVDLAGSGIGLEVGCGSGFNTALLSSYARSIIATDLPYNDPNTHSLGMVVAKELLSGLNVENAKLISCSGEILPFHDNTFDFVYSSSVLEHINDKERALTEMLRVCKDGGKVIFVIPTFVQSACAFIHLYLYIGRRILDVIRAKLGGGDPGKKTLLPKADDKSRSGSSIAGSFRKNHPSFPLPEPHGAYRDIFHEFANQLPWSWTGMAKRCGARSVKSYAFMFLPFNILEIFSTRLIARLYSASRAFHSVAGRTFLKHFSYSLCVVADK